MPTITFLPHNRTVETAEGQILIRAAMEAGVHINASCGGEGVCGKCRVLIEAGAVEGGISEKLSLGDIEKGYRLACQSVIRSDLTVRIPVESEIDSAVLNLHKLPRKTARIQEMDLEQLKEQGLFHPPVEKKFLVLPAPTAQDNVADVTRLIQFLKIEHDEHRLEVDLEVIRKIPAILRQSDFKATATLVRPVHAGRKTRITNIQPGDTTQRNYAVAMDIGTTTLYGQIVDLTDGRVMAQYGEFNHQISYGEDVISRIVYAEKGDGLQTLSELVVASINTIIGKLIRRAQVDIDDVATITMAGNTTMTQLMLKVEPRYIRRSPYVPASEIYPPLKASELGIELAEHALALVFPAISSYVGGDIVAGVMGSGFYRTDKLTLFMDIGTNAEIVVGNKDWMACAAASAGPAFEGGGITFGMRAARGAIEDFSVDPLTLEPMVLTIGNVRPKGICGSGLLTMVAVLFEMGLIDPTGKYRRDSNTPRLRETDGIWEYVVAWRRETQIDRDIVLTEIDIENLIRAKGAMYGGYTTLLAEVGLSIQDLEQVILAGGFGSYVDLEKAMTIGLLPEVDPGKVVFVGNGSLMGAKMSALTNQIRRDVVSTMRRMTNFELSETSSYMDNYVAALFLPHTDLNLFPRLKMRLDGRKRQPQ